MGNVSQDSTPKLAHHLSEFVTYEVTAGLAFAGNLLVCILFFRKKTLLKKSYNMYFLGLALLDILIAVTMAITYAIVLIDVIPFSFGNRRLGEFVCRVLWSRWLLYCLFALSVYICLFLTIERWYAVVRPLNYQGTSNKKRVIISIVIATVFALIFTCTFPMEVSYLSGLSGHTMTCVWKPVTGYSSGVWGVFQFIGLLFVPSLIMIGLFCHIIYKKQVTVMPMHDFRSRRHSNMITQTVHTTQRTVTKMIATASIFMILCWAPNQVYYLLSRFGILKRDSTIHHYLEALTFFNSCVNPVIYGVTSQTFRKGYWEVFLGLCPASIRLRLAQSRGGLGETVGSVVFLVHTLHRRRSYDWRFEGIRASVAVQVENNPTMSSDAIAVPQSLHI
ncbi:somatostatin receptor type 4-like [Exaiptasia diaphana]|uniref:G-protein coupled receptors family 1 profile domain-containing protein n=1 Tax=Exaiptasia diaphana TaxID=2652724 RepID=A0A913Y3N1_EXADI|nr:somatostatin receptor type 4-like [Exaiptasia diaphana]